MKEELVYNRYAIALLQLSVEKGQPEEYRKEVKCIREILRSNKEFLTVIDDVNLTLNEKYDMIDRIFSSANEDIRIFMKIIIRNGRAFHLYNIFKETLFRFDDYLNIEEGVIYCTEDLSDKDIKKAIKAIEKKTNKTLEVEKVIDPSLLGGFKIQIKDNVYDVSLKKRLDALKEELK